MQQSIFIISIKTQKPAGVIDEDKAYGTKRIAEPLGVICAVIPTTNPTSTAIFKTLISLKTRNGIIISPLQGQRNLPQQQPKSFLMQQ